MARLVTLVALFLTSGLSLAQQLPANISFEHIPVPGTIESALTEDIIQDPYGMMWMAKDALYRYNGREFKKYEVIYPDSSLFSTREITRLFWDEKTDRLLIGTRNYGIVQYTYETNRMERMPSRDGVPIISDIARVGDRLWVASFSSNLFQIENDTLVKHTFTEVRSPTRVAAGGKDLWVGCLNEIVAIRGDRVRRRISLSMYNTFTPNSLRASALMFDRSGHLWVGTERDGLLVVDTLTEKLVHRFSPQEPPFYNSITSIVQDQSDLVWIATKGDGLVLYSPEHDNFRQVTKSDFEEGSLSGENCTSIWIDKSGIVWIGSSGDINKYDRSKIKFVLYRHNPYQPNSLSDDNIRNIYQDDDGLIYLATSGGYINTIDRAKNKIDHYKVGLDRSKEFIIPLSIIAFDKTRLLIGTSEGLLLFDKNTKNFSPFAPLARETLGLPVRQIIHHAGMYYMLVRGKVLAFDPATSSRKIFGSESKIENASCIAFDNQRRLWIGTRDGLIYSDPQLDQFNMIALAHDKDRPDSSFFLTLSMQPIGNNLWVNSFNNAIYIVDLAINPPRLTERITTDHGLPNNTVYAAIPDRNGNVWISHNSGLSQYDPQKHRFIHFSASEGLQDEEFNRLAFFKAKSGEIMLGGINGINIFDPGKITLSPINIGIRMVSMNIHSSKEIVSMKILPLIKHPENIELAHDQNAIQFEFFIPDFHDPIRYQLRYKLEPFDKAWIETDKFTSNTYTNLPAGNFKFTAKAIGYDGEERIAAVAFTIQPPYWKTWWFLTVGAIALSFIVYAIIYFNIEAAKRESMRLESLLKIRTSEIEQSREELTNLNRKKDLIFSILSHDLRSPLTTLKGFLGLLIDNGDAMSKEDLHKYAINIRNSVTTSLDLIDNTLFWSLSQTGNIQCTPTNIPLGPVLEKIKGLYQLTAEKKQIVMNFVPVNGLAVYADENMLYVLLRNLVSNAIKFTPEKNSIHVDALQENGHIMIKVKDTGVGMTPDEINKIFMLDNPMVKKGTSSEKGTGLGLTLCKKFIEVNHGKLLIESKAGLGSSFTVVLPSSKE
jgi:signal transduction histidine kinase/ligand-binding sensor domain-containing protein